MFPIVAALCFFGSSLEVNVVYHIWLLIFPWTIIYQYFLIVTFIVHILFSLLYVSWPLPSLLQSSLDKYVTLFCGKIRLYWHSYFEGKKGFSLARKMYSSPDSQGIITWISKLTKYLKQIISYIEFILFYPTKGDRPKLNSRLRAVTRAVSREKLKKKLQTYGKNSRKNITENRK